MTAPPAIAIIKRDEPDLVNFPKSAIAKGHKAGHIKAHPSAMKEMQKMDISAGVSTTNTEPMIAKIEQIFNAVA